MEMTNRSITYKEIISVYCESHVEHVNNAVGRMQSSFQL
jgi:hypothetical protein